MNLKIFLASRNKFSIQINPNINKIKNNKTKQKIDVSGMHILSVKRKSI